MSDAAMDRLMNLIHQGYSVDMTVDDEKRYVEIKIRKNKWKAGLILTYDELDSATFDVGLYKINKLVEKMEKGAI